MSNAQRQIQLERDRAVAQIREEAVDLSLAIASKLIRRNLTKADNESLIDEALEAGRIPPGSVIATQI